MQHTKILEQLRVLEDDVAQLKITSTAPSTLVSSPVKCLVCDDIRQQLERAQVAAKAQLDATLQRLETTHTETTKVMNETKGLVAQAHKLVADAKKSTLAPELLENLQRLERELQTKLTNTGKRGSKVKIPTADEEKGKESTTSK